MNRAVELYLPRHRFYFPNHAIAAMRDTKLHAVVSDSPKIVPEPALLAVKKRHVHSDRLTVRISNSHFAQDFR